jgi:hypothetical protein
LDIKRRITRFFFAILASWRDNSSSHHTRQL